MSTVLGADSKAWLLNGLPLILNAWPILKQLANNKTGIDLIKLFGHKFTYSFALARSFYSNATNIACVYKIV